MKEPPFNGECGNSQENEFGEENENSEREKKIRELLFSMVRDDHGTPREEEEDESLISSRRAASRIERALSEEEVEVPYKLLVELNSFVQDVSKKADFRLIISPEMMNIIGDVLAAHYTEISYPEHDQHKLVEDIMEKALGDGLESRILDIFNILGAREPQQILELFEKLYKFYRVFRRVINSKDSFGPSENPEYFIEENVDSQLVKEILEGRSTDDLANNPIKAVSVLRNFAEFDDELPISWEECTGIEQQIILSAMQEAILDRPDLEIINTPEGPEIAPKER